MVQTSPCIDYVPRHHAGMAFGYLAGQSRSLADYRGKVELLKFWASWCPPCRKEMPSMERLRTKMAGRPLAIVAVSSAEHPADVTDYLARMPLGFDVLLDVGGANTRGWKVFALPSSFLIDAAGKLRYVVPDPPNGVKAKGSR